MLKALAAQWRCFLVALGFLTRVPVMYLNDFKQSDLDAALKYFPFIGLFVGALGAIVYWLALQVFPIAIAVMLSMASTIYLTGAFHEDGLADSVDGIGGGLDRAQMLTIMQDSRLGTYGAIALFGVLFVKFQSLSALPPEWVLALLMVAHTLSRLASVWMMALTPLARLSGKSKPQATKLSGLDLCVASVIGLLPLALFALWQWLQLGHSQPVILLFWVVLLTVILVVWWWRQKVLRQLGGYTGDTLGALQQLTELSIYLVVLAWSTLK